MEDKKQKNNQHISFNSFRYTYNNYEPQIYSYQWSFQQKLADSNNDVATTRGFMSANMLRETS